MNNQKMIRATFIVLWAAGTCWASGCTEASQKPQQEIPKDDPLSIVLEKLNKTTSELKSFQSQIEYKFSQPLLESESQWKGALYYARSGKTSMLSIHFNTIRQDDEKEQKTLEQYFVLDGTQLPVPYRELNGIWLAHLDYQIKEAKYYQLAEPNDPNEPTDVFELASRNLPMLGFTKTEDLKKQFEVSLVEPEKTGSEEFIQVHLKVKPNSIYKDDYISIDFWIDEKLNLPAKIVAVKTEPEPPYGDIVEIKFLKPKVNKSIDKTVFEFKIPKDFGEPQVTPLERRKK